MNNETDKNNANDKRLGVPLVAIAGVHSQSLDKNAAQKPSVIYLVIDTLRQDHLSAYGYHRRTSPNIDKLAHEGVLFSNAYTTSPFTPPATASLLTGLYPSQMQFHFPRGIWLPGSAETIAESLMREGYMTYGISGNFLISQSSGFDQGFKIYENGTHSGIS